MLDVRRLRVLREVATHGSFSAAAEALSYTQSAVSQQIAALERECATKLLERGPRGVRLTEAGRALVQHADAILARIDDAEEELAAIAGLRGGRLRIATFQSAGATLVPRAVGEFHRRHPGVELSIIQEELEAVDKLMTGEVDMALVMGFPEPTPPPAVDLDLAKLLDDPYDLVLPEGHRLAGKRTVDLKDLADERWIVATRYSGCREGVVGACRFAGFEPNLSIESDENTQTVAFVATGLGIALVPRLGLSALHAGVVIKRLPRSGLKRTIWAATVADAYRSPATEAMIEILRDVSVEFAEQAPLAAA
jgi:DNA-binding transcriptional LysR family regulator